MSASFFQEYIMTWMSNKLNYNTQKSNIPAFQHEYQQKTTFNARMSLILFDDVKEKSNSRFCSVVSKSKHHHFPSLLVMTNILMIRLSSGTKWRKKALHLRGLHSCRSPAAALRERTSSQSFSLQQRRLYFSPPRTVANWIRPETVRSRASIARLSLPSPTTTIVFYFLLNNPHFRSNLLDAMHNTVGMRTKIKKGLYYDAHVCGGSASRNNRSFCPYVC